MIQSTHTCTLNITVKCREGETKEDVRRWLVNQIWERIGDDLEEVTEEE